MPSPRHDRCRGGGVEARPRTRRAGRTRSARRRSSSEYDQSTVARSVWWRSTAVRRPPVRSRNRSSRRRRSPPGSSPTTRAAASSIASGMPSRRRQISATAPTFASSSAKSAWRRVAPARRRAAPRRSLATASRPAPRQGCRSDRSGQHLLTVDREPFATRREDPHARAVAEHALGEHRPRRRAGARSCRARAGARLARRYSTDARRERQPGRVAARPSVGGDDLRPSSRRRPPPRARTTTRRRGTAGSTSAATCTARRVLPTPPTPVSVTSARVAAAPRRSRRARRSRPTNDVSCSGRLPGNASSDRSGGNSSAQPAARDLEDPLGVGRGRAGGARRGRQARRRRSGRATSSSVAVRDHDLAAVRRRRSAAPRGSPRCRSSRRRAARPHRCAGPSARAAARAASHGSSASARCASIAAVDRVVPRRANAAWRPSPVVFTTCPPCASIASRRISSWRAQRRPHRLGVLLPEARRALEVGEQERDRPRRQLGHVAPSSWAITRSSSANARATASS